MTEFKFVGEVLPHGAGRKNNPVTARFADALRANPNQWAEYPLPLGSVTSMYTQASNIRQGGGRAAMPFRNGTFEAQVVTGSDKSKTLYVRYVGGES